MAVAMRVLLRDADLRVVDEIPWLRLDVTLRHLAVSSWGVTLRDRPRWAEQIGPGAGVVILRDDKHLVSGSLDDDGPHEWNAESEDRLSPGEVTIYGGDDLAIVADELAYADPANPENAQSKAQDTRSGAAETVIKGYVAANVGTTRPAWRNDTPGQHLLTVISDQGRGGSVSYSARYDPLMDVVRTLGVAGGLGVSVTQQGTALEFDVYEPADQSATARFSPDLGNVRRLSWRRSAPKVTHALVAGQGEGTARTLVIRKDLGAAAEWRRVSRVFVDQRHTNVLSELQQAGDEAIAEGARSGVIAAELVDTPRLRLLDDVGLGDIVTVEVTPSITFPDVVSEIRIRADENGERITATVGNPAELSGTPEVYQHLDRINRRVAGLEVRI